ncbi:MAG: NADP-specific glutamate dehydrogenase, partial [Oscillospiraceae bacterium]|nr:NADP-specific glutamate dehydrogenase [Oscillospiraceae bacterium]
MNKYIERVLEETRAKNPDEKLFLQTVEEVLLSVEPLINAHPEYEAACILERMVEPERAVEFRVVWMDDQLKYHVNRGYRVQFNASLGPHKGGLRFSSKVNLDTIKFLGFEQVYKDALTCLPIGGAKGGSDFDPIGKSDGEVMRFC